ncbi:MAG: glycosyltransferase family 1 protein [Lachnospiraceae bacterium]|nr:glycosyltransferase family 1 protein [Lachnospiraceae bacterium]
MKKIRVLQFTIAETKGGRTLYTLNNWKYINKEKFQFDFITFNKELDFEQQLLKEGCQVWHISCYPEDNREQFIKEFDAVLEHGYDIIHINTSYWRDTIVEERAKAKGIRKIIIHAHNMGTGTIQSEDKDNEMRKRHFEVRERLTEDLATDYWACSSEAAEWLYGDKISKNRIVLMKTAIDINNFDYDSIDRDKTRKDLGLEKRFVIGNVGKIVYQKNHEFLIHVFYEIRKTIPNAFLLIRGEGALKECIEKQIKELHLEDDVKIMGRTNSLGKIFSAMDLFLMPSRYEGFPAVLVEAQASGLPCIVSDSISKETRITSLVSYKPLILDKWVKETEEIYGQRRERKGMSFELKIAGYDIWNQIQKIENAYMENVK